MFPAEPEWRKEVARRLETYRSRRRPRLEGSQTGLPFQAEPESNPSPSGPPRVLARIRPIERVEISASQSEQDFSRHPSERFASPVSLLPVAGIRERRFAGLLDAAFLLGVYLGFLGMFRTLGGHFAFDRVDAVVFAASFFLFYVLYFSLFATFTGATPGMQLRGLSVVSLDGNEPEMRQLLWRSFGYVVSGATLLLGFFWALWDEDKLTWQDRISHTFVIAVQPEADEERLDSAPAEHTLASK